LGDFIDTPVKHYSSGMYVRLGFAVAIHTDLDVLVVDEVLTVGDQTFEQKCLDRIFELKKRGVAVVLVSHSLADVERLCSRALWLQSGHVEADGDASIIVDQYLMDANDRYYQQRQKRADEAEAADEVIEMGQQRENRWGTRQADITDVKILNADGEAPQYFEIGDKLIVSLSYRTRERIEAPAFGIAFYRRDGVHVNGPNSVHEGFNIPFIDGTGVVDYIVDSLPMIPGHYEATVAIYNTDSTVAIDHHHRMYNFEIRPRHAIHEEGVVHIPARWQHTPALTSALKLADSTNVAPSN
jgi:hypothetical protein